MIAFQSDCLKINKYVKKIPKVIDKILTSMYSMKHRKKSHIPFTGGSEDGKEKRDSTNNH